MRSFLAIAAFLSLLNIVRSVLITEYEWHYFDYDWETQSRKDWYIQNKLYIPQNMVPIDVDRSTDKRMFLTIIRAHGVPATLHTVSTLHGKSGPLLKPYPSWSWYESDKLCDNIVSVYRIAIDECHRLWVLDTGSMQGEHLCPAKLLVFDLHTDELLLREELHEDVAQNRHGMGLLVTPIVETYGYGCYNSTVYMADMDGHGLVIWNNHRTVRLEAGILKPDERHSEFSIDRESFHLSKGVFGMALSPKMSPRSGRLEGTDKRRRTAYDEEEEEEGEEEEDDVDRYLYFQPLSSKSMFGAESKVLKNSLVSNDIQYFGAVDVLPSQSSAQAFSSEGALFYAPTRQMAIGCWNFKKPMMPKYFRTLLTDRERLQFVSGMKVIKSTYFGEKKEYLLMMTNRLQKIHSHTMDLREVNFRILTAPVRNLIHGTVCDEGYAKNTHSAH